MDDKGIVRNVDQMGRVVIPNEIRKQLNIEAEKDKLEIFVKGDEILLRKYRPACFICDNLDELVDYNGYKICLSCIEKLQKLKDEM